MSQLEMSVIPSCIQPIQKDKVLKRVTALQHQTLMEDTDYLVLFQSGFTSSLGTESALITLLSFPVALDTIKHGIILEHLCWLRVGVTVFHSYLWGPSQEDQGTILSQTSFNIYMNPLRGKSLGDLRYGDFNVLILASSVQQPFLRMVNQMSMESHWHLVKYHVLVQYPVLVKYPVLAVVQHMSMGSPPERT